MSWNILGRVLFWFLLLPRIAYIPYRTHTWRQRLVAVTAKICVVSPNKIPLAPSKLYQPTRPPQQKTTLVLHLLTATFSRLRLRTIQQVLQRQCSGGQCSLVFLHEYNIWRKSSSTKCSTPFSKLDFEKVIYYSFLSTIILNIRLPYQN